MLARVLLFIFISFPAATFADNLHPLDLKVRGVAIVAEVAATPQARAQGLMYRKQLRENRGMLFIFSKSDYYSMWMSNTYIPLSVAFLSERGVILNIEDMAPLTTEPHSAAAPAKFALEMNRGWFKAHRVKAGDQVTELPPAAAGL